MHTPEQTERIRKYESATDKALVEFYENAQTLPDWEANHSRYEICKVGARLAGIVSKLVGFDTEGWPVSLSGNHAVHIYRGHGPAGTHDHSLADSAHVGRLAFILDHLDEAGFLVAQNGEIVHSFEYRNADGTPAPMINIRMRIDGFVAVQQAVPDSKAHCIHIVSMRIQK